MWSRNFPVMWISMRAREHQLIVSRHRVLKGVVFRNFSETLTQDTTRTSWHHILPNKYFAWKEVLKRILEERLWNTFFHACLPHFTHSRELWNGPCTRLDVVTEAGEDSVSHYWEYLITICVPTISFVRMFVLGENLFIDTFRNRSFFHQVPQLQPSTVLGS